jgi:demethylmenaquinone methyltransferase/2-methoxy-6-polyprenyl-1,4-benzoquinol methylase
MDKRRQVTQYFEAIGRRYDMADALMSFGLHFLWRRFCLRRLAVKEGYRILDLCGGTGEFARRIAGTRIEGLPVVCDLSRAMMAAGKSRGGQTPFQRRIQWVQGDAEHLAFPDQTFDAVLVGYGIRNLADLPGGLQEMHRVLRAGGSLIVMEFSIPRTPWIRILYHWYSFKIMPAFGRAVTGRAAPFVYLAESIRSFPAPETVQAMLEAAGFLGVTHTRLSDGIVAVYCGRKAGSFSS